MQLIHNEVVIWDYCDLWKHSYVIHIDTMGQD